MAGRRGYDDIGENMMNERVERASEVRNGSTTSCILTLGQARVVDTDRPEEGRNSHPGLPKDHPGVGKQAPDTLIHT